MKKYIRHNQCGFTLVELAIVLGIIGAIIAAIWTAAAAVYASQHTQKASTETLMIVQGFKSLYGNGPITDTNGTDITKVAISAGIFPADMIQAGNTSYGVGPWPGSQVNIISASVWNGITIEFSAIDQDACNRLANVIATGTNLTAAGLVWAGVNGTSRTFPPFGSDQPFTASDVATACGTASTGGAGINVQVTYALN